MKSFTKTLMVAGMGLMFAWAAHGQHAPLRRPFLSPKLRSLQLKTVSDPKPSTPRHRKEQDPEIILTPKARSTQIPTAEVKRDPDYVMRERSLVNLGKHPMRHRW